MQLLRAASYRRMPWKNGGGETAEIAIQPPGASLETFEWRVSMANVATDGPFSRFAGVDRTLCVLQGEGLRLDVEGQSPVALTADSPPHAFAADVPTDARLMSGAITDLNVMTRRARWQHRVRRERFAGVFEVEVAEQTLIVCASTGISATGGATPLMLERHDSLLVSSAESPVRLEAAAEAALIVIEFERCGEVE